MCRWLLVQELFEQAVVLDFADRARLLRERAQADATLVRDVEGLLAADSTPLAELERGATQLLQELAVEPPPETLNGTTCGAYHVDEHLASGGMGHVYRATRTTAGARRRVALKVLRAGLDSERFLERFQRERATLAALEHEHVVTFLDAGALPDGRPFLVMEYVDGVPLTTWGRTLALRERLRLFVRVLAAVQYAHQKLIVHRDLKPSNVLVTRGGAPKLCDFGVAAALAPDGGAARNGHTQDGPGQAAQGGPSSEVEREALVAPAPLTPSYASPEQLRGEPATTAGDIYSLGVLLHELATGELPRSKADGQLLMNAALGPDLKAIVDKACAVDPDRRYHSADGLADDLQRLLAAEPVSAYRCGCSHRSALYVCRHRSALALAAALMLAIVLGWVRIGSAPTQRRARVRGRMGRARSGQGRRARARALGPRERGR